MDSTGDEGAGRLDCEPGTGEAAGDKAGDAGITPPAPTLSGPGHGARDKEGDDGGVNCLKGGGSGGRA